MKSNQKWVIKGKCQSMNWRSFRIWSKNRRSRKKITHIYVTINKCLCDNTPLFWLRLLLLCCAELLLLLLYLLENETIRRFRRYWLRVNVLNKKTESFKISRRRSWFYDHYCQCCMHHKIFFRNINLR